jgi:hypothetical protein
MTGSRTPFDGDLEWTMTTDLEREANYAIWRFDMAEPRRYEVQVHLDGGEFGRSRRARYLVQHGGATDEVVIDQSSESGFVTRRPDVHVADLERADAFSRVLGRPADLRVITRLEPGHRVELRRGGSGRARVDRDHGSGQDVVSPASPVLVGHMAAPRNSRRFMLHSRDRRADHPGLRRNASVRLPISTMSNISELPSQGEAACGNRRPHDVRRVGRARSTVGPSWQTPVSSDPSPR